MFGAVCSNVDGSLFQVGVCTLWSIRLVIFAKQSLKHMISHVQQSSVKTGIANALGTFFIFTNSNRY